MKNPRVIKLSPEKDNIKIKVYKVNHNLEETLGWLVEELASQKRCTAKTIVYCQSISNCGELYSLFSESIPSDAMLFAMYHSKTPTDIQSQVLEQFIQLDSAIRVVFATSALGMVVNVPDIRRVIHYGIPRDLEQYVQEIGRGGRDGKQSESIMFYCPYHLAHCDNSVRDFVKNTSGQCRRELIANYFKEKPLITEVKHTCCDHCAKHCDCGEAECTEDKILSSKLVKEKCCRTVNESERELLKDILHEVQSSFENTVSILGMNSLSSLSSGVISELLNNSHYIFTLESDVMEYSGILDISLAHEVLIAFNDVFDGDIDEYELIKSANQDLLEDTDKYGFVPDWCTQDSISESEEQTDSSDSDSELQ